MYDNTYRNAHLPHFRLTNHPQSCRIKSLPKQLRMPVHSLLNFPCLFPRILRQISLEHGADLYPLSIRDLVVRIHGSEALREPGGAGAQGELFGEEGAEGAFVAVVVLPGCFLAVLGGVLEWGDEVGGGRTLLQ